MPTVDGCARSGTRGEEHFKLGVSLETSDQDKCRLITCIIK